MPQWPAPARVQAGTFTRALEGELDAGLLADGFGIEREGLFLARLEQVHGARTVEVGRDSALERADACYSREPGAVAMVRTADCLPLLVCDCDGTEVLAVHAGWRGLAAGVIESGLACLQAPPDRLLVWLGPCISQANFEVGPEVREAFMSRAQPSTRAATEACFMARGEKYLADLYQLARIRLRGSGVEAIYGGGLCTYADSQRFHSYRRDGAAAGRLYSAILLT